MATTGLLMRKTDFDLRVPLSQTLQVRYEFLGMDAVWPPLALAPTDGGESNPR
jgi:hypothetical protein